VRRRGVQDSIHSKLDTGCKDVCVLFRRAIGGHADAAGNAYLNPRYGAGAGIIKSRFDRRRADIHGEDKRRLNAGEIQRNWSLKAARECVTQVQVSTHPDPLSAREREIGTT
jgi:hypothetical protein